MKIIFIVDGDETPVQSVDWPVAPRVGEIVQFSFGKYPYIDLTVTRVTYMPMLTFIDADGKHMPDGLLISVALSLPPTDKTCWLCNGSGKITDMNPDKLQNIEDGTCVTCGGDGTIDTRIRTPLTHAPIHVTCNHCVGSGKEPVEE